MSIQLLIMHESRLGLYYRAAKAFDSPQNMWGLAKLPFPLSLEFFKVVSYYLLFILKPCTFLPGVVVRPAPAYQLVASSIQAISIDFLNSAAFI